MPDASRGKARALAEREFEVYMRAADEALYCSKANGCNCVTIFPRSASSSAELEAEQQRQSV